MGRILKQKKKKSINNYWLRNVHPLKMDVSLSDLAYRIPYGQARNLLSATANLPLEKIIKSRESGSIFKRLKQGFLIEVKNDVKIEIPNRQVVDSEKISFPNRVKSGIVVENTLTENIQTSIISEEDNLIEELEREFKSSAEEVPLISSLGNEKKNKM